jgi:CHRD domain
MHRKRLAALGALGCTALAVAGVAAASHRAQGTQQAAASFNATTVTHSKTATCTGSDGTYEQTTATYTGTATSSDTRLDGPLTIRAHSVFNTTSGLGWVEGSFRVKGSSGDVHGTLHAAISGANAVGALDGKAGHPEGKLIASLAAAFAPSTGFSSGSLGSGTVNGAGVVFQQGDCKRVKPPAKPKPPKHTRSTAVSQLNFSSHDEVPPVSGKGTGKGSFTLDLTRDSTGTITGAKAVFYVNYRFDAPVTITGLALHQGAKGTNGPIVLDSGQGTLADADGNGNLTQVVASVPGSLAESLLASPHGYYVELTTSDSGLRAQLGGFSNH